MPSFSQGCWHGSVSLLGSPRERVSAEGLLGVQHPALGRTCSCARSSVQRFGCAGRWACARPSPIGRLPRPRHLRSSGDFARQSPCAEGTGLRSNSAERRRLRPRLGLAPRHLITARVKLPAVQPGHRPERLNGERQVGPHCRCLTCSDSKDFVEAREGGLCAILCGSSAVARSRSGRWFRSRVLRRS